MALATSNYVLITMMICLYFILAIIDTGFGRYMARMHAKEYGLPVREIVLSKKTRIGFIAKFIIFSGVISFVFLFDFFLVDVILFYWKEDFPFHYVLTAIFILIFISWEIDSLDEHIYNLTGFTILQKIKGTLIKGKSQIISILKAKNEIKDEF